MMRQISFLLLGIVFSDISRGVVCSDHEGDPESKIQFNSSYKVLDPSFPFVRVVNGTLADREKLRHTLFEKYDKKVIPDDVSVKFGLALINFEVIEKKSIVEAGVWFRYVWNDTRLAWKSEDYGGVGVLRVPPEDVWHPDITLYNSAAQSEQLKCTMTHVLIYPNGEVLWVPPCDLRALCELHPYSEKQTCSFKFGSWVFDGNIMDLRFYNDEEKIDLSDYWDVSDWEILSTVAKKTTKKYDCCEEPYPDLTFNMTIRRRPTNGCAML